MTRLIALLIFTLAMPALLQAKTLTPDEFADAYAKAVGAMRPSFSVVRKEPLSLSINVPSGRTMTVFLDNAYRDYIADPGQLDAILNKYASAMVETAERTNAVDPSRIVPVVKDRQWLVAMEKAAAQQQKTNVVGDLYESLNDELVVLYAEDNPRNIHYIGPKEVADLGIARKELRALAILNLRQVIPPIEFHRGAMFSWITAGGDYETSLLLFDDIWAKASTMVNGEIVLAVPARGLLLFTGARNLAGIAQLRAVAAKAAREEKYAMTPSLFVRRNGQLVRFEANAP
jgi:uncharacterized protein YtpQ (UPF0354 family)